MVEIPSSAEVAIISGDFHGFSANALYEHFVDAKLLTHWWSETASLDVRVAGAYVLTWPQMDWTLRGVYTAIEPGKHLGFTWNWDHEPSQRERFVDVWFIDMQELGSRVAVHMGPFGFEEAEQTDRRGIIEGWIHFGMRLAGLRVGDAT